jgi:heptosyltransferase-1
MPRYTPFVPEVQRTTSILPAMLALPAPLREALESRGSGLTVLVLRLGAMGDIVRTLPPVRLVRSGLPNARIHWVAWEPWADILTDHPDIDGLVSLPRSRFRALARSPLRWPRLARAAWSVALELRVLRAGLVLDFHGDLRTGVLGVISGAPVRIGYLGHQQKEGNRAFTTHRVPSGDRRTPRLERNLDLVRALGLPVRPVPDAGIAIARNDVLTAEAIVRSLVPGGGAYAVLNPGASRRQAYKKPPAGLFAAAARALAVQGVCPLVVCGPGEDADADLVIAAANGMARRTPSTTLKVLAALLRGARVFVGGDSGPLHLACGVGCPVVGLYGPTDPVVNTPWNVPFVALARPQSAHTGIKAHDRATEGFDGLEPATVGDAIQEILRQPRGASTSR